MSKPSAITSVRLSAWSPLRHPAFATLWTATLISNIGTWMHDMSAGWLMTTLAPTPLMVALVQAATTLPVFLFSLPAGALADRMDRRRMLIAVQLIMAVIALLVGMLVLTANMTATRLLALTFALGIGAAASSPVWQAIVPRLTPKEDFPAAVALNAVSINLSRAIGPTLGGVIIAGVGMAWPFMLNALSFVAIIAALLWWRPQAAAAAVPAAGFIEDMIAGVQHVVRSAPLRATLMRTLAFFVFASAYWALLPLIARDRLVGGSRLYGVLLGCIGAGAVTGAQFLPRLRARFGADRIVIVSTAGTVIVMTIFAFTRSPALAIVASVAAGAAWLAAISTFNIAVQLLLPDAVRARGMAVYNTVFYGALAFGSIGWGQLAQHSSIAASLVTAATGALLAMRLAKRYSLGHHH